MDDHLRQHRDASLAQLAALVDRGRMIRHSRQLDAARAWQQDCAAVITQLSGGSKAHWLSRAFSGAFLVRGADGGTVLEADAMEIVDRILGVLMQGMTSLAQMGEGTTASIAAPPPRLFEFVHDEGLRPVLERAYADSRDALDRGEFALSLILSCSVVDALLTDALERAGRGQLAGGSESFDARIEAAEVAGLIRGSCARLPSIARAYRDLTDAAGELRRDAQVSEREARLAGQVLRVVIRDLDPGR
jgi:hypothetical protein